jgi:hypothetical protein
MCPSINSLADRPANTSRGRVSDDNYSGGAELVTLASVVQQILTPFLPNLGKLGLLIS